MSHPAMDPESLDIRARAPRAQGVSDAGARAQDQSGRNMLAGMAERSYSGDDPFVEELLRAMLEPMPEDPDRDWRWVF